MKNVPISATQALSKLQEGNARFVAGDRCVDICQSYTRLDEHLDGQAPFAVILSCSDSRVPVEIVFDAGLGDLFIVRVAGNIVTPALMGSIELAVEKFGPRLVVVLGHSGCGAVDVTIQAMKNVDGMMTDHVSSIIERIRPAITEVLEADAEGDHAVLLQDAVRSNVRAGVDALLYGSSTLAGYVRDYGLLVVGAEYSLETGQVNFFAGSPDKS
ncbi:MAG: carbonic anhydrase [Woeseiaceae bacterium]|nr:carbonic anhydrase [Woeseiaceae bacterium]